MHDDGTSDRVRELLAHGVDESTLRERVVPDTREKRVAQFFGPPSGRSNGLLPDLSLAGALTLGDLLYDWFRVDPMVLQGVDFASRESVSDVFRFAHYASELDDLYGLAREGAVNRLQGYVGERVIAAQLQAAGHVVTFPQGPSEPGWDILVDGRPFQVKCVGDPRLVLEHLERYPGIPVYAPVELADALSGQDGVHFIGGFSHGEVADLTRSSLDAGTDLLDFEIPWVSVGMAAVRNVGSVFGPAGDVQAFVINVLSDSAGGIGGGFAGAKAGALALGLVFGPAGALIGGFGGAVAGGTTGRRAARLARTYLARAEETQVTHAAVRLLSRAAAEIDLKLHALREQAEGTARHLTASSQANLAVLSYFDERVSMQSDALIRRQREMRAFSQTPTLLGEDASVQAARATSHIVGSGVHPVGLQSEYRDLILAEQALKNRKRTLRIR